MKKLNFALRVLLSCDTQDQMVNTVLWADTILSVSEMHSFIQSACQVPSFDLAIHNTRNALRYVLDSEYYDMFQTTH